MINTENSKMELERELKSTKSKIAYVAEEMRAMKKTSSNVSKYLGIGFSAGLALGVAVTIAAVHFVRTKG